MTDKTLKILLGKISITVLAGQQPQTPRHMDH